MFFGVFMGLTGSYFLSVFYILLAGLINQWNYRINQNISLQ
jgi:hypothetical protein